MTEDFLHYIWQNNLYRSERNCTADNEIVELVLPGQLNTNAGPDFQNARIRIDNTLWVGCVEVHLRSSDWVRHGHHLDPAYNNVVLHVVYQHDAEVFNTRGQKIPVMELYFDATYFDNYHRLLSNQSRIACLDDLGKISDLVMTAWLDRLSVERLEQKSEVIMQTYTRTGNDWEETLYQRMACNFGFNLNALPFETLARSLPFKILLKHKDNLQQIEALLFGQAGMLTDENPADAYQASLHAEYKFLQQKYQLTPIDGFLWKFLRLRPANFPTLRLAQFAALIHQSEHLFSKIIETDNPKSFKQLFNLHASVYWETHYVFGKASAKSGKSFGQAAFLTIMINTIAPFLFVYGRARGKEAYRTRAFDLLEHLPPEHNATLKQWEELGITHENALHSQALLQLKNEYCAPKRCLQCAIGSKIVKNKQHI